MAWSSGGSSARGLFALRFPGRVWLYLCTQRLGEISPPESMNHPGDLARARRAPLEPQTFTLRDGLMPGGYAELAVDRLGVRLDGIRRDVELVPDLAKRERAAEQAQDRRLALGERLGDMRFMVAAAEPPVEFGQPGPERIGAVWQGGQHLSRLLGQLRGAGLVPGFEADPGQQERGHDGAPRAEPRRLAELEHRLELAAGLVELAPRGLDRPGRRVGH